MILFIILAFGMIISPSYAGPVEAAKHAYLSGDFTGVERLVKEYGADPLLTSASKAELYFTLGCVEALRGRATAAELAFRQALSLYSDLSYTSADVPPPAWRIYKPIYDEFIQHRDEKTDKVIPATPVKSEPLRIDTIKITEPRYIYHRAAWKSLVYPGWGHLSEGQRQGLWLIAGETALLGSWIWAMTITESKRDEYIASRSPAEIERNYDIYNRYYQIQWGLGAAALGLYLYSQFDYFTHPPLKIELTHTDSGLQAVLRLCIK